MSDTVVVSTELGTREIDEDRGLVYTDGKGSVSLRDMSISDVHISSAMSNFVTGYGKNQDQAIADLVMPPLLVEKPYDTYHTFDKDDKFQYVNDMIASENAPLKEVTPRKSTATYSCVARGLASFISQGSLAAADPRVDPRMAALSRIMNAMTLGREYRVISALQNGTTFTSYTAAIAAGSKWNGGASSDPIADLTAAMQAALMPITHIVMSERTWHSFIQNVNVSKHFTYSGVASIGSNTQTISNLLGLPPIIVSKMKGKSLSDGTYGYIWGNAVSLLHIPANAGVSAEEVPTARTFRWNKAGNAGGNGFRLRSWFEQNRGQDGGEMIAVLCNDDEKVVAANTGYLLTACYQ